MRRLVHDRCLLAALLMLAPLALVDRAFGQASSVTTSAPSQGRVEQARVERRMIVDDSLPAPLAERLPLDLIGGPHRERAIEVLQNPQLHHRGPAEVFSCDAELFSWLINHPDWVSQFWREVGFPVEEVHPMRDGGYTCREERGMARFHTVYEQDDLRIIYCYLEYRHPLLPRKLRVEMVLVHRYRTMTRSGSSPIVIHRLEGYARSKNLSIRALMKISRETSDELFERTLKDLMLYFSLMGRVIQQRPTWAEQTFRGLTQDESKEMAEFRRILVRLNQPVPPQIFAPSEIDYPRPPAVATPPVLSSLPDADVK
ncbi:hypothetical protein Pan216_47790 [Planctomycetes bacterium Pan216]|uniref:Methanolan biosynthesis EpsI domain-containing protein n=1 Tax=Kolteria novifilia TaxID=2527975 RepID=A0A518BA90_9BACT|nr:hypothetical protein Pan216_47790 [Planctomycetes bacterium Pan216]